MKRFPKNMETQYPLADKDQPFIATHTRGAYTFIVLRSKKAADTRIVIIPLEAT